MTWQERTRGHPIAGHPSAGRACFKCESARRPRSPGRGDSAPSSARPRCAHQPGDLVTPDVVTGASGRSSRSSGHRNPVVVLPQLAHDNQVHNGDSPDDDCLDVGELLAGGGDEELLDRETAGEQLAAIHVFTRNGVDAEKPWTAPRCGADPDSSDHPPPWQVLWTARGRRWQRLRSQGAPSRSE